MYDVALIEGIGEFYQQKLKSAGVGSLQVLLRTGRNSFNRSKLSEKTGISEYKINNWIFRADLMRIRGIGKQYAELLTAAGVSSMEELSKEDSLSLYKKMLIVNSERSIAKVIPSIHRLKEFISQAGNLNSRLYS